jgi:hypothetical protein
VRLLNSILESIDGRAGSGVIFGLVLLRMRRSLIRLPRCVLNIFGAGLRVPEECSSIECYKVAPIRDPDLDREQTSKKGRENEKERGLTVIKASSVERAACPIHIPGEDAPA